MVSDLRKTDLFFRAVFSQERLGLVFILVVIPWKAHRVTQRSAFHNLAWVLVVAREFHSHC